MLQNRYFATPPWIASRQLSSLKENLLLVLSRVLNPADAGWDVVLFTVVVPHRLEGHGLELLRVGQACAQIPVRLELFEHVHRLEQRLQQQYAEYGMELQVVTLSDSVLVLFSSNATLGFYYDPVLEVWSGFAVQ